MLGGMVPPEKVRTPKKLNYGKAWIATEAQINRVRTPKKLNYGKASLGSWHASFPVRTPKKLNYGKAYIASSSISLLVRTPKKLNYGKADEILAIKIMGIINFALIRRRVVVCERTP